MNKDTNTKNKNKIINKIYNIFMFKLNFHLTISLFKIFLKYIFNIKCRIAIK